MFSLYLHFPFCKRKCSYCDFCSAPADDATVAAYCAALQEEIMLLGKAYGHPPADTVYLGGGTPSAVPASLMRGVLQSLRTSFHLRPDAEFSSEANPGTLSDAWLDALTEGGCNRLSIGVQAIQPQLLRTLGRIHDTRQAMQALDMACRHGIRNLNADAMFGLPGQTEADYLDTLRALSEAQVTHISAYSLILEEGTPLFDLVRRGEVTPPGEDETAGMMESGLRLLSSLGYARYEISNFARPGFVCRHNMAYWRQTPYLGLGLSAASLLPDSAQADGARYVRRVNTVRMDEYLRTLGEGRIPAAETTPIHREEAMFETVMLGLRTVDGVGFDEFAAMHGVGLREAFGDAVDQLERDGLLAPIAGEKPRLRLNERGLALQNTALMPFLKDHLQ